MATPVFIVAGQSNAYSLNGGNGGVSVAQQYTAMTGSSDVVVASVVSPGAPLTWGRDGEDWYSPGELFDDLVAAIKQALATPDTYLASIVWIQGEGDTWSFSRATQYAERLTNLVNRLQDKLLPLDAQTHDFRFTVLSLSENAPAKVRQSNWETIHNQQMSLDHPRIDVVDVDAVTSGQTHGQALFQPDGLHYAAAANDPVLAAMLDLAPLRLTGTMGNDVLRGLGQGDTLRGGAGQDRLDGQDGNDYVRGWTGNDTLVGGQGNDVLIGDQGTDKFYGGDGADLFVFCNSVDVGTTLATADQLVDFRSGVDVIDLRGIDANSNSKWNQAFHSLGFDPFDGTAGALRWYHSGQGLVLQMDFDGDKVADGFIILSQTTMLTAADLIL